MPVAVKTASDLAQEWAAFREANPKARIRKAAAALGVSEAELLATTVGDGAIRLNTDWKGIVKSLEKLGYVMSLTRNEHCVIEHKGRFEKVAVYGKEAPKMGLSIGPIETRIFFDHWHVGFAVETQTGEGQRFSLQFFDKAGDSVLKVFLQPESEYEAFERIAVDFRAEDQSQEQPLPGYSPKAYAEKVDAAALREDWAALKDTHDFVNMLNRHNVERIHALHLAGERFAEQLEPSCVETVLSHAAAAKMPIMVFVGSRGNIQIHQDAVRKVVRMHGWLNVLDPQFNLHLKDEAVHTAWLVRKPTEDGVVTGVELFAEDGTFIAQLFGLRKPGVPEREDWRELAEGLTRKAVD